MPKENDSSEDYATASLPAVWVVIFDQLTVDEACDQLDLESTFFEQFMLQDVRSTAGAADLFGGDPAFIKLAGAMAASDQSASLISLTVNDRTAVDDCVRDDLEAAMRRCGVPVIAVAACCCGGREASKQLASCSIEVSSPVSANLVWIEASVAMSLDSANGRQRVLDFVEDLLRGRAEQSAKLPVLIVTSRRGDDCEVRKPLQSGLSENRIHAPLWIRHGAEHACRVQALAGSFDLLPTISEFLSHALPSGNFVPSAISGTTEESESPVDEMSSPLSSSPTSLDRLCGAPQVCPDRLLKLCGDGWKAARTENFLLVISGSRKTESDGHDSEESSRRLFVKPDDRFNVSDVAGTYATVADELTSLIE